MEHSLTSATGTGWEPTPWHATQRAAWAALVKAEHLRCSGPGLALLALPPLSVDGWTDSTKMRRDLQIVFS
jgi:hypothetical protein